MKGRWLCFCSPACREDFFAGSDPSVGERIEDGGAILETLEGERECPTCGKDH